MAKAQTGMTMVATAWLLFSIPASSSPRIDMRLTPTVSLAPGFVRVSIRIEADVRNRSLEVVAETPEFRRSSEISLDGARAPRVSTFEFRDLPTGVYEVTGTLADDTGARTSIARTLVVAESGASRPR